MNLRLRFTLLFSTICLCILGTFSVFVYLQVKANQFQRIQRELSQTIDHEWEHIQFPSHSLKKDSSLHVKHIYLKITKENQVIFNTFPQDFKMDPSLGVMKTAEKTLDRVSYELTSFYNAQGTLNYLRSLRNVLFLCCFAALFILLPISFIFTRILLKPFRTLAQQTSQLSAEKLSYRFEKPKYKDELGTLTLNFNLLLDKLESSFEQIKNFTANASHEIRTPLTAIIVQLQMLERKPEFKAEPTGTIKKVLNQAFHLKDIVNKLLLLFEVDRIEKEKTLSKISITETITQALETLKFKYKKDEFDISLPKEDVYFHGNETLISCIVTNIIENALKYSFSQIKISIESSPSTLNLIVEDDGPGIKDTQTAKLSDGESHGLGLSIVKACLESLSGQIIFEKSQLGGLKVVISLPRNDLNLHSIDHLESATL